MTLEELLVLIPAFNEAGRVGDVVRGVQRVLPHAEVVVIDDGSRDDTGREARDAGARVLSLPVNSGYGVALQTGYMYALREGHALIAQIDADGQHLPEYLPAMLEQLNTTNADVVIGSRFLDRDGHYQPSKARKLGIAVFGAIATMVTRQHVSDPTSGLQVMRGTVATFFCSDVYPVDYPDADILILLHRSGFRISEVPVKMAPSVNESMHSGHRSIYYVYKMTLSIFLTLLRPNERRSR